MREIKLAVDTISHDDIDALIGWLKTFPKLTKGELTIEFEKKWASYLGVDHAVFVNSGSSAILLSLAALIEMKYINRGDKIVVPAVSWSTDLSSALHLGLMPIMCDCNMGNLSVDIEQLEYIFRHHKPKAMLLVAVLGLAPNMVDVTTLCDQYDVLIVEDTCESLGSTFMGQQLGSFGLMSVFSTYFGHHISTIEGGMVCTNDRRIYNCLKSMRSHGWDRDLDDDFRDRIRASNSIDPFRAMYTFYTAGFNFRANDLQAFIGLRQLDILPDVVEQRHHNFQLYSEHINNPYWMPEETPKSFTSNFAYPVISPYKKSMVQALSAHGVEIRPLICGSLMQQPFALHNEDIQRNNYATEFENAKIVHSYGLYLPNNCYIKAEEIEFISEIVNDCCEVKL